MQEATAYASRGQVVSDQRLIASDAYIATSAGEGRVPVKVAETVDVPRFMEQMFEALKR